MNGSWEQGVLNTVLQTSRSEIEVDEFERLVAEKVRTPSETSKLSPMRFLYGCLTRTNAEMRKCSESAKTAFLEKVNSIIFNYMALCISDPSLIPYYATKRPVPPAAVEFLFMIGSQKVPAEFLPGFVSAVGDDQELLAQALQAVLEASGDIMGKLSMTDDDCLAPVRAFANLVQTPPLTKLVTLLPQWIEVNLLGAAQQNLSILGPFFRLTSLPEDPRVGEKYFADPSQREESDITQSIDKIQSILRSMWTLLHDTLRKLLSDKTTRDAVVAWFAVMMESNVARAKMRADQSLISTDGEFLNIAAVLLRLCAPFIDPAADKLKLIDPSYTAGGSRLDFSDETRIAASMSQARAWSQSLKIDQLPTPPSATDYWPPWSKHLHIICDGCKAKSFGGARYKCSVCSDFDICESCFMKDSDELYALSELDKLTFQCPYCGDADFSEMGLCTHVATNHATNPTPVVCPICVAQPGGNPHMYSRNYQEHLKERHADAFRRHHDRSHYYLKLRHTVPNPSAPWKLFPPVAGIEGTNVHEGIACSHCHTSPIVGVRYRNCHGQDNLCQDCEAKGISNRTHIYLRMPRPLPAEVESSADLTLPLLFPPVLTPSRQFNFITDCFFLTARALHIGMMRTCARYTSLVRDIPPYAGPQRDQLLAIRLSCDAHLLDETLLTSTLQFYCGTAQFMANLIKIVPSGDVPQEPVPAEYANLPEHLINDMTEFIAFLARYSPAVLAKGNLTPVMVLFTGVLASPKFLNNPHVHGKIVEMMCSFAPINDEDIPSSGIPSLAYLFETNDYVLHHITPALMHLYIAIEHTGADTQFYDKFSVRHAIALLLKYLWRIPYHRQKIQTESNDSHKFLLFINMLVNDATYLLDESFAKLHDVVEFERLSASDAEWNALSQGEQRQKLQANQERESHLRTLCLLGNETINMIHYLSDDEAVKRVFWVPEMIERIAAMLDYLMGELAGPNMASLKVAQPEKYYFHPKRLLRQIVETYLHLAKNDKFSEAVARDGRSFKPIVFRQSLEIMKSRDLAPADVIMGFDAFLTKTEGMLSKSQQDDEDFAEAPEEFYDPITCVIMEDPVELPNSGQVVDRAVIARHLLTDQRDPFSRAPLAIDQVIPATDLKKRIDDFKQKMARRVARLSLTQPLPAPPPLE